MSEFNWLVSYCPDKNLIGRKFRGVDIQYGTWPEGTIFTNIGSGEIKVIAKDSKAKPKRKILRRPVASWEEAEE